MIVWIFPALITTVLSINQMCPGGSYSCPDDATCCQLLDKTYGCCPLKNAVCCDDHIHCCPQNSKCESGICVQLNNLNATAHKLTIKINNNTCSDTRFVCPDESTCCRGSEPGTYGCCPMEDAVCCEDGTHCCPEGTVCDLQEERCIGEGFITEMYDSQKTKIQFKSVKYSSLEKSVNYSNIICPGGSFQCPSRDTCCQLPNGDWGCCPFQNAKCCNDHLHCCPEYMQCDSKSQSCFQGSKKIPSVVKKPSKPIDVSVTCPDNTTCAESMTCCKINHMHYGCCLYPNAVCCRDLLHCCPSDYICDDIGKQCIPKKKKNA